MKTALLLSAWLAIGLAALPAMADPTTFDPLEVPGSAGSSTGDAGLFQEGMRLLQAGQASEALAAFDRYMATPAFKQLSQSDQFYVRAVRLQTLVRNGWAKEAYPDLKSITDSGADQNGDEWLMRMEAALRLEDRADGLKCFVVFVRRWPARLSQVNDEFVFRMVHLGRNIPSLRTAYVEAMLALYESKWRPQDPLITLDSEHLALASALLDDGRTALARDVISTISSPDAVASMRMQRRFDGLEPPALRQQGLTQLSDRRTQFLRDTVKDTPDRLKAVNALTNDLYNRGRLSEALALADDAIARAKPASAGRSPFLDPEELIWTYNLRAETLLFLGRGDEAIAAMTAGAGRLERGASNVSQTLNLAEFDVLLGRPQEALALTDPVTAGVSGYGRMVREEVRAQAYILLHDDARLKEPLDYIKAHLSDSPSALFQILVRTGDDEGAVREMLSLLKDPAHQGTLLSQLQDYEVPDSAPAAIKDRVTRVRALRDRPEVKAALSSYGRIQSLPFLVSW